MRSIYCKLFPYLQLRRDCCFFSTTYMNSEVSIPQILFVILIREQAGTYK